MVVARYWLPMVLVSVSQTARQRSYSVVHRVRAVRSVRPKYLEKYDGTFVATACGRAVVGVPPLALADKQKPRRCVPCFKVGPQVAEVDRWSIELLGAEHLY